MHQRRFTGQRCCQPAVIPAVMFRREPSRLYTLPALRLWFSQASAGLSSALPPGKCATSAVARLEGFTDFDSIHGGVSCPRAQKFKSAASAIPPHRPENRQPDSRHSRSLRAISGIDICGVDESLNRALPLPVQSCQHARLYAFSMFQSSSRTILRSPIMSESAQASASPFLQRTMDAQGQTI
jgi:hypothetical protein